MGELQRFIDAQQQQQQQQQQQAGRPAGEGASALPLADAGKALEELRRAAIAAGMSFQAAKAAGKTDLERFLARQESAAPDAVAERKSRAPSLPPPKPANAGRTISTAASTNDAPVVPPHAQSTLGEQPREERLRQHDTRNSPALAVFHKHTGGYTGLMDAEGL